MAKGVMTFEEFKSKKNGLRKADTVAFIKSQGFEMVSANATIEKWVHSEHKDIFFSLSVHTNDISNDHKKQDIVRAMKTLLQRSSKPKAEATSEIVSTAVSSIEVLTDSNYPELRYSFEVPFALHDDLKDVLRSENADLFKPYLDEYKQVLASLTDLGFKVVRNEEKGAVNYNNPELGISQEGNYLISGFQGIIQFAKRVKDKAETKALTRIEEVESFTKLGGKFEVTPKTNQLTIRYNDGSAHVKHAKVMGADNIPDMAAHQIIEKAIKDITLFQEKMESMRSRKSSNHYNQASTLAKAAIVEIFAGKEVGLEELAKSKGMNPVFIKELLDPEALNKPLPPRSTTKTILEKRLIDAMKDLYTGPRNGKVREQHEATITKALAIIFDDLGQRRVGSIDPNQFVRQAGGGWVQILNNGSDITAHEQHTR